ncbi:hypothetical protein [Merismopedia glauca]|uniref:Uncharacterized protein n=1 Tax=Merismopedia glauca CCAP 1448/3 TaxID=1296344 RepID=A0A2T1BXV5_9CYAN|nr:hypothetical protein [Merismopedia glauca]PSB00822.1 hypothetical protein C7B64_21500 [Merismopedia glauca CCAP 1448/3]
MSLKLLGLGLFCGSVIVGGYAASVPSASAQCVMADISIQSNISGSRRPANQSNNVTQESHGGCSGNTAVSTNVQSNVGGREPVTQRRESRQRIDGNSDGKGGSTVKIPVSVQVDVYNAADNFRR